MSNSEMSLEGIATVWTRARVVSKHEYYSRQVRESGLRSSGEAGISNGESGIRSSGETGISNGESGIRSSGETDIRNGESGMRSSGEADIRSGETDIRNGEASISLHGVGF